MTCAPVLTMPLAVIDYGCGNLRSLGRALAVAGALDVRLARTPADLSGVAALILPGVGAFGEAMERLRSSRLAQEIVAHVRGGAPLLGICLGMQLLHEESREFGCHEGLALIPGRVEHFDTDLATRTATKIPHVGWSSVEPGDRFCGSAWAESPLGHVGPADYFYFVHSFFSVPARGDHVLAWSTYNRQRFCSVVANERVIGTQFHPEKSGPVGIEIVRRFLTVVAARPQ